MYINVFSEYDLAYIFLFFPIIFSICCVLLVDGVVPLFYVGFHCYLMESLIVMLLLWSIYFLFLLLDLHFQLFLLISICFHGQSTSSLPKRNPARPQLPYWQHGHLEPCVRNNIGDKVVITGMDSSPPTRISEAEKCHLHTQTYVLSSLSSSSYR